MATKIIKPQQPVDGPYTQMRFNFQSKQGKNNTFTWTEKTEEYAGPAKGVYTKTIQGYVNPKKED